jgi:hypothetical protein
MKVIFRQSRLLTTVFLCLGFVAYILYIIFNKLNGGSLCNEYFGWLVFDVIVFGAIIVGMWVKKAHALVNPSLIALTSINLAINSIDYLAFYRYIGDSTKPQLNVWLAALNATACFIALIVFLLSYLIVSKTKLLRMIGIIMLIEVSLGYLFAGIMDFSTAHHVDGIWDLTIFCIWVGMVFGSLYRQDEREKQAA